MQQIIINLCFLTVLEKIKETRLKFSQGNGKEW